MRGEAVVEFCTRTWHTRSSSWLEDGQTRSIARIDEGDYIRAAGDAECPGTRGFSCGLPYRDHPFVPGIEWLHRTCDGRLVKL